MASVRSPDEFVAAVQLFTHVWGGHINPILPAPLGDRQESEFRRAIHRLDPDGVFSIDRDLGTREARVMSRTGRLHGTLTKRRIEQHARGEELLRLRYGLLPHVFQALSGVHPDGLSSSAIRFVPGADLIGSALFGSACPKYVEYLTKEFSAEGLKAPTTAQDWVQLSAIGSTFSYLPSLATVGCNVHKSIQMFGQSEMSELEKPMATSPQVALIFLPGEDDLATLCAFWNSRARSTRSSLLLPRRIFLDSAAGSLETLWSISRPKQLLLVSQCSPSIAREVLGAASAATEKISPSTKVAILHDGIAYTSLRADARAVTLRSERVEGGRGRRYAISADTPRGLDHRDLLFSATVKIRSDSGVVLRLPDSAPVARVLTNSAEALERARGDARGQLWLRNYDRVRAMHEGVRGLMQPGKEFEFYLHEESLFVEEELIAAGFSISAHRHNRYARGFIRRCGGLEEALRLVYLGSLRVLVILGTDKTQQPGLLADQIVGRLRTETGRTTSEARKLLADVLPLLLRAGLVIRGIGLTCPHCDLSEWYSIDGIAELVQCPGCMDEFQLDGNQARYRFRLNELARRFLAEGGRAVLECAKTLKRIDSSIALAFGGEVITPSGVEAEIDLIALTPSGLVFAECKSFRSPTGSILDQLEVSVESLVDRTIEAGLEEALICVACSKGEEEVLGRCRALEGEAATRGVQLDLVLNERFYLRCRDEASVDRISYLSEPVVQERLGRIQGELIGTYGFGGPGGALDSEVVRTWESRRRVERAAS